MPRLNHAKVGQTAALKPKSPTGGHQRPPSDSRGTVQAANADAEPAIIVFGLDPTGNGSPG